MNIKIRLENKLSIMVIDAKLVIIYTIDKFLLYLFLVFHFVNIFSLESV